MANTICGGINIDPGNIEPKKFSWLVFLPKCCPQEAKICGSFGTQIVLRSFCEVFGKITPRKEHCPVKSPSSAGGAQQVSASHVTRYS
jgi:hypothetical protein